MSGGSMRRPTWSKAIGFAIATMVTLPLPLEGAAPKKGKANPDAALIAEASSAVMAKLRDPGSAQFRNVRAVTTILGSKKVCGEVNAKNGYGGYTGFSRFVFLGLVAFEPKDGQSGLDLYSSLAQHDCD